MNITNNRICFFDKSVIDEEKTTSQRCEHQPEKQAFCAEFNTPHEIECAFPNIVFDGKKYRMYYMAGARLDMDRIVQIDPNYSQQLKHVVDETIADGFKICYMESEDGINWEKPVLDICDFHGSKKNNIILKKPVEFFVMKDNNPECKDGEEYKAVYNDGNRLFCMFSPDGIHFSEGGLISEKGGLYDTLNTVHYNPERKHYGSFLKKRISC